MSIVKNYIKIPDGQLHYIWRSGIGTPIVCFHQTASSCESYRKIMQQGVIPNPMYAFDTPGFGGSFDPIGMPLFEQFALWIKEGIKALGITEFYGLGHHTGAGIVVELSALDQKSVRAMILIGPYPMTADEREAFRKDFSSPIAPTMDGEYLLTTWNYLMKLGANNDLTLHHNEVLNHVRAYYSRYQTYSSVWDYDFTTPYKNATCPIMLMASESDVLFPFLERAKELQPNATRHIIDGANFEPDLDSENISRLIGEFVSTT